MDVRPRLGKRGVARRGLHDAQLLDATRLVSERRASKTMDGATGGTRVGTGLPMGTGVADLAGETRRYRRMGAAV
ncbi:hypothetical protein Csa_021513 [Cucumis sativus]|nr:hypothetical protein Csa_021513 [Cucumis sativus]